MQDFAKNQGLTFTILLDETGGVARRYELRGIPTSLFIDGDGVIRARYAGALDEALIKENVDPLLP